MSNKPWPEQLKERFLWYSDNAGKQYLWDDLGQQKVDEVIMEDFIQTVVVPQIHTQALKQGREEMMKEVMGIVPEEIDKESEVFDSLFGWPDCCGKGEEDGFNACRSQFLLALDNLKQKKLI